MQEIEALLEASSGIFSEFQLFVDGDLLVDGDTEIVLDLEVANLITVDASIGATSELSGEGVPSFSLSADIVANSDMTAVTGRVLEADANLAGGSAVISTLQKLVGVSAAVNGNSGLTGTIGKYLNVQANLTAQGAFSSHLNARSEESQVIAANSNFIVNPAHVHVVNLRRGPQIPVTSKPIKIPKVGSTPFYTPASYSIIPGKRGQRK